MSLWSFQGARELESPPAENTAVTAHAGSEESPYGPTDLSKLNSVLAHHIAEAALDGRSKCDPRSDEVNIDLGEL